MQNNIYDNDLILPLQNELQEYYKKSKFHYLNREPSYNNLLTIIRQICKSHNIPIISKILYNMFFVITGMIAATPYNDHIDNIIKNICLFIARSPT